MIETTINDAPTMRDEAERGTARLRPGDEILGRYVVQGELGQGGMGVVYKCLDKVGGVEVAVKGLPPEVSHNADEMAEVRDNYRLVQGLRHPNICGVKTLEMDARGDYYLVMDLAHGENLNRWLRKQPDATDAQKIAILRQIAAALDYAHARKIIHRDVKPENVMVAEDGTAQVLDFGLAAQVRSSLSRTSQAVTSKSGTPGYKAPEQWLGRPQGPASDQYALGVIAYKMFAGFLPFDGDDIVVLGQAVLTAPAEPVDGAPAAVNAALAKVLAKKPGERFVSCSEFVDALVGGTTAEKPRSVPRQSPKEEADIYLVEFEAKDLFELKVAKAKEPSEAPLREQFRRQRAFYSAATSALSHGDQTSARRLFAEFTKSVAEYDSALAEAERKAEEARQAELARKRQAEAKRLFGVGVNAGQVQEMRLPGGVKMKFVWCPSGSFMMGSPTDEDGRSDDEAQHFVMLTKGFWLGQYEVTQTEWKSIMGDNPSHYKGDNLPVDSVSWEDCQKFIEKCNDAVLGVRFALPTEAQWEYACRAGSTGPFAGSGDLDEMGWFEGDCGAHPVGQKQPNAWNLYDMHGNVYEWCADWYGSYEGDCTDPMGPASGSYRVLRGGSWAATRSTAVLPPATATPRRTASTTATAASASVAPQDCTSKMAEPGKKRQPEASRAERGFAEQKPGCRAACGKMNDETHWTFV